MKKYFKVKVNEFGTEFDVWFNNHDAYLEGVLRSPTMAKGGVEIVQQILIEKDGFSVFTDELHKFSDLEEAKNFAIESAMEEITWWKSTTPREQRALMIGRQ